MSRELYQRHHPQSSNYANGASWSSDEAQYTQSPSRHAVVYHIQQPRYVDPSGRHDLDFATYDGGYLNLSQSMYSGWPAQDGDRDELYSPSYSHRTASDHDESLSRHSTHSPEQRRPSLHTTNTTYPPKQPINRHHSNNTTSYSPPTLSRDRTLSFSPTTSTTTTTTQHQRPHCTHPKCLDPTTGQPERFFSRRADLARHYRSIHEKQFFDCPKSKCPRKGDNGFTRQDHLKEHLRGMHGIVGERGRERGGRA